MLFFLVVLKNKAPRWHEPLGITILHNGMILSTLSISSRDFASGFPKMPHASGNSIPHL